MDAGFWDAILKAILSLIISGAAILKGRSYYRFKYKKEDRRSNPNGPVGEFSVSGLVEKMRAIHREENAPLVKILENIQGAQALIASSTSRNEEKLNSIEGNQAGIHEAFLTLPYRIKEEVHAVIDGIQNEAKIRARKTHRRKHSR